MNILPLSHLIILELENSLSGAFTGKLFAKFGAKVFMNEPSKEGNQTRYLVPSSYQKAWWESLSRNKKSIRVDPTSTKISVTDILSCVDIVITDIGPSQWKYDPWLKHYERCAQKPLVIDIFPSGVDMKELWQGLPLAEFTAANSGMMNLTGWEDGPPAGVEAPIAEYLSGVMAASGALAELNYARQNNSIPRPIQMGMHEAVLRMIEWQLPISRLQNKPVIRNGNNFPMNAGISNMPMTKDGKHIAISAASQEVAIRLLNLIGGPELANDPDYANPEARSKNMLELYKKLNAWVASKTQEEILILAEQADIVVGPVLNSQDILNDPLFKDRGNLKHSQNQEALTYHTYDIPKISGVDQALYQQAPDIGMHTQEFFDLISKK